MATPVDGLADRLFNDKPSPLLGPHFRLFIDGAAASCIAETVSLPLEVAKMRLQLQRGDKLPTHGLRYTGMLNAFSTIVKQERWVSLWKGLEAGLHKQFLYTGLRLGLYEHLSSGAEETPMHMKLSYAAVTTGIGILIANPADVVQTRYIAHRQTAALRLYPTLPPGPPLTPGPPRTPNTPPTDATQPGKAPRGLQPGTQQTRNGLASCPCSGPRPAAVPQPVIAGGRGAKHVHMAAHLPVACYSRPAHPATHWTSLAHHVHHHHWRLQHSRARGGGASSAPLPSGPRTVTGVPLQNARMAYLVILREEGLVKGLYRGFMANFACNCFQGAAEIATYDVTKGVLKTAGYKDGMPLHLAAGMAAGLMATVVSNPLDVVSTRLMAARKAQTTKNASMFRMIGNIWEREGFMSFYKGFGPNVLRIGTFNIVLWLSYEQIRQLGH